MANTRECWVCGKVYEYCYKCDKVNSWKLSACSRVHFQIITILNEYHGKVLTIKEAQQKLSNIGIDVNSDLSDLLPAVKAEIMQIVNYVDTSIVEDKMDVDNDMVADTYTATINKTIKQTKQNNSQLNK